LLSKLWKLKHFSDLKYCSDADGVFYNELHFTYKLQRMPSFYISTMIIPIWLIFTLSMFVFYLPAGAGEKMTLSISILIGQTVFLTLLAKRVPETSVHIPLLGGYLLFTMTPFFICGSVLCATNTVVRSFLGQAMFCSFCSP